MTMRFSDKEIAVFSCIVFGIVGAALAAVGGLVYWIFW